MTGTGKTEVIRFILKAIITIARHIKPLSPDIADIINEGNKLVEEL